MSGRVTLMALAGGFASLIPSLASAATYQVGPTRTYRDLGAIAALVSPGDVVEVDGGATYPAVRFTRPGDAGAKITIRGLKVGGRRPILNGGTNTIDASADHYVFEGLEITGGGSRCFFHHADDITIRDSVIHDCPKQGLLGADNDSGSLLLEYSEFYGSGGGDRDHQIYMATDESAHPGAVFRMQFCYVHDGNGGNNVKSRAERNEIYYNWIEGAYYHELELIGPDPDGGVSASLRREDSDVVGNVLVKRRDFSFVRVGGDGTGETNGRYRFVNNTFIGFGSGSTAFRIFDGVDSVEMHNNVFWRDGGAFNITRTAEASWVAGEQIAGQNNFVVTGAGAVPSAWTSTITGASPGFIDASRDDFRPAAGSALVDEGALPTTSPPGHEFPAPLPRPLFHPPRRTLIAPGTAEPRPDDGALDIGAYELAGGPGTPDGGVGGSGGASSGGASSGGASSGGASSGGASSGGASSGGASSGGASSGGASSGGASSGGASSGGASSGGASSGGGAGASGSSGGHGDDAQDDGGCAVRAGAHGAPHTLVFTAFILALALARRRRLPA